MRSKQSLMTHMSKRIEQKGAAIIIAPTAAGVILPQFDIYVSKQRYPINHSLARYD